jgi:hypothetical protein
MLNVEDCHKCYKVRLQVQFNIDETYYIIAKNVLQAAQRATDIFNTRGAALTPELCITEVTKTDLKIWFDREDWG